MAQILASIDNKNVVIQSKGISLDVETALIRDLVQEMQHLRDSWESVVQEAKLVAEAVGVQPQFPENRKISIEPEQDFRISVVYPVLDFIINDLMTRFEAADTICELFSPILSFQNLDDGQLTVKAEQQNL